VEKITVAIAGSTGLVGGFLLRKLLDDVAVGQVIAPTRRPLPPHPKLSNPHFDGAHWPSLPTIDEAYCALGTTRADAGSVDAFRAVDLGLVESFSRASKKAGARRFALVSSVGANKKSRFVYPRTKAEAEAVVTGQGFENIVIARPSFLLGTRAQYRPAEKVALTAFQVFGSFMVGPLRPWRAVPAELVASSLIATLRGRIPGTLILESDRLNPME
jgi:uncharacterized protein YbjT (DUF2867 family)